MAQIVLIDTGTLNIVINETYDIVARHEDDVDLITGGGYDSYRVVKITGLNLAQIDEILNPKIPIINRVYKPISQPAKWTFIKPEDDNIDQKKLVWLNTDNKWYFLEDKPKYSINIPFSVSNIEDFENIAIPNSTKIQVINSVAKEKMHLKSVNMIEAKDLN